MDGINGMMTQIDEKRTWYVLDVDDLGVYNELMDVLGIKGLELVDIPKVKFSVLKSLMPVHGIIFLFKRFYNDEEMGPVLPPSMCHGIFYAKQIIYNANVLHAILSVALNCANKNVCFGEMLAAFKSNYTYSSPFSRGMALRNNDILRQVHNYFALRSLPSQIEETPKDNNRYHYTSLVPIGGRLYEIDGMKEGPVDLGAADDENEWLKFVRRIMKRRMIIYNKKQINYKIMIMISRKRKYSDGEMFNGVGKLQTWTLLTDFKRRRMSVKRRKKMKDAKKLHEDSWSAFIEKWSEIYAESVALRDAIKDKIKEMGDEILYQSSYDSECHDLRNDGPYPKYFSDGFEDSCEEGMFCYKSQRKRLKILLTKDENI